MQKHDNSPTRIRQKNTPSPARKGSVRFADSPTTPRAIEETPLSEETLLNAPLSPTSPHLKRQHSASSNMTLFQRIEGQNNSKVNKACRVTAALLLATTALSVPGLHLLAFTENDPDQRELYRNVAQSITETISMGGILSFAVLIIKNIPFHKDTNDDQKFEPPTSVSRVQSQINRGYRR